MRWVALALALVAALASGSGCRDADAQRERWLAQARASEATGDLERAADALERGLAADPRDVALRKALAEHWIGRGRWQSARRVLDTMPEDVARDDGYLQLQARVAVEGGPVHEAARALATLEGDLDGDALERFVGRWIESDAEPGLLAPLPRRVRLRAVEELIGEAALERATRAWRVLAATEPEGDELLESLAERALRREDWGVLEALEPELRSRTRAGTSLALHKLLIRRGAWAEAASIERDFLESRPDDPDRYDLVLAGARRESRAGSPRLGLRLARTATKLRPDLAAGFVEQAIALRALGRREKALRAVRSALLVEPADTLALRLLAELEPAPSRPGIDHRLSIELR